MMVYQLSSMQNCFHATVPKHFAKVLSFLRLAPNILPHALPCAVLRKAFVQAPKARAKSYQVLGTFLVGENWAE